jgi:hypothetical protein
MAGWKEWAIGEVVEAGDIQGFIQNQTVMVFDTDTARDTALSGVVIEGMMAYTKDSDLVKVYDGAAWIGLAEAPDLTTLIPKSTVTTAGDLIVADGASSVTRLGVGADGSLVTVAAGSPAYLTPGTDDQVLTLVSGAPAWADAGGGGGGQELITSVSLSGSSTTISSITQAYTHLKIMVVNGTQGSGGDEFRMVALTGATYTDGRTSGQRANTNYNAAYLVVDGVQSTGNSIYSITLDNYSSTSTSKPFHAYGGGTYTNNTPVMLGGSYDTPNAITQLIFEAKSGYSWTGGTVFLYGVN